MAERTYVIGEYSYTAEEFRALTADQQVELMVEWFGERYEDPAQRTPYNSREGGYLWIHGGPYDADEEVQSEFSDVAEFEVMQRAVEEITSDGLYEWAPVASDDDFYDDREYEEPDRPEGAAEPEDLRGELLTRLDRLEAALHAYGQNLAPRNHNHPPELVEEDLVTPEQLAEAQEAVDILRAEAGKDEPESQILQTQATILYRIRSAIWSGVKVLAAGVAGSAAWEAIVWVHNNPKELHDAMMAVAETASQWSHQLTGWF